MRCSRYESDRRQRGGAQHPGRDHIQRTSMIPMGQTRGAPDQPANVRKQTGSVPRPETRRARGRHGGGVVSREAARAPSAEVWSGRCPSHRGAPDRRLGDGAGRPFDRVWIAFAFESIRVSPSFNRSATADVVAFGRWCASGVTVASLCAGRPAVGRRNVEAWSIIGWCLGRRVDVMPSMAATAHSYVGRLYGSRSRATSEVGRRDSSRRGVARRYVPAPRWAVPLGVVPLMF